MCCLRWSKHKLSQRIGQTIKLCRRDDRKKISFPARPNVFAKKYSSMQTTYIAIIWVRISKGLKIKPD